MCASLISSDCLSHQLCVPHSSALSASLIRYAIAQPMVPIEPPTTDMFELRVIVWDAIDVQARDESFFGGGGTSDVFVAITPHGHQPYSMLRTDVHHRSPGGSCCLDRLLIAFGSPLDCLWIAS